MACGVPVVSTTGGALPEVVGDAGILVPPENAPALAGAITELLNQPVGANERRRVQRTAAWWYRRAARCGHVVAQLNLGELYSVGVGVARDLVQAYMWLGLAARGNNRWASEFQHRIASEMTPSQLATAVRQLESWVVASDCAR